MRRFWAHIIIAFTALASIATTVSIVGSKTNGNIEYLEGREMIFRISNKDGDDLPIDKDATDKAISVMNERLKNSNITYYSIEKADVANTEETVRNESYVKVKLRSDDGDMSYQQIAFYLTFNGSLALTDNAESTDYALFKDIMTDKAYYEPYNQFFPAIVIPIDNTPNGTFDTLLTQAKNNGTPETSGEGEEATSNLFLYTWYDFNPEFDSYNKTVETLPDGSANPEFDSNVAAKLLNFSFNITNDQCFYPDDKKDKLFAILNITESAEEQATMEDAQAGFITAKYIVNLFNSSELDYKVEAINSTSMKIAAPLIENIKTQDQAIAWSRTFIATLIGVLILCLLIAVFYKLSAVSICTVSLLTTFFSFLVLIGLGAEFSTAALIGFIIVALASVASGVLYANRLKEECYRGRTIKKANAETSRKTLFPIIDINLIPVVIGGFIFLFGGDLFRSFGLICIIGGLISGAMNLLGLRGMMWLATNTTAFIGKYELFGIESDKVANHLEGEKQSYFGPYQDKDFTKRKKPTAIICGAIFLACLVGVITFGSIKGGHLFNTGNLTNNSEIYFTDNSRIATDNPYREETVKDIINNILVYEDNSQNAQKLSSFINGYDKNFEDSVNSFTYVSKPEGAGETDINYFYYIVKLNHALDGNKVKAYTADTPVASESALTLNEVLRQSVEKKGYANADAYSYIDTYSATELPSWPMICLGSFVACAVLTVYFCLRYRLSRGLTSILFPFLACTVGIGFFALFQIVAPYYIVAGLPLVLAFTLTISVFFMEKEKDVLLDQKTRDNSPEFRNEIMKKANSLAFTPILIFSILAIYLAINFFGFGAKACCEVFLVAILGMLFASFTVVILYGPVASLLYKLFHKIGVNFDRPNKKNKKNNKPVHKSAEPEEAIFIGIND